MLRIFTGNQVGETTNLIFDFTLCTMILASLIMCLMRRKRTRYKNQYAFQFVNPLAPLDVGLSVKSWTTNEAVAPIVEYLKKSGIHICIVRKRAALEKFIDIASQTGGFEMVERLTKIQKSHQAIAVPLTDGGDEDWGRAKLIISESNKDELVDGFMVADTGRVAKL